MSTRSQMVPSINEGTSDFGGSGWYRAMIGLGAS
jgi:hypothetical protein